MEGWAVIRLSIKGEWGTPVTSPYFLPLSLDKTEYLCSARESGSPGRQRSASWSVKILFSKAFDIPLLERNGSIETESVPGTVKWLRTGRGARGAWCLLCIAWKKINPSYAKLHYMKNIC